MRRKILTWAAAAALLVLVPFAAGAQEQKTELGVVTVTGNYHMEADDWDYADGFDVLGSFDFLVWDLLDLYVGPRVGWYSETVPTGLGGMHQKPSVGGEAYLLYPAPFLPALAGTAGFAFDLLINIDGTHPDQPVYMFASAFLGARITFGSFHVEGRLEAGAFPFFDYVPYFLKFGFQVGYHI